MKVPLELIPLGRDGAVNAVPVQVLVDGSGSDSGLRNRCPELEGDENGDELSEERQREEDGVRGQEEPLFRAGNGKSEEADAEGVDAEDDHVGWNDAKVGRPEVKLVNVVELH